MRTVPTLFENEGAASSLGNKGVGSNLEVASKINHLRLTHFVPKYSLPSSSLGFGRNLLAGTLSARLAASALSFTEANSQYLSVFSLTGVSNTGREAPAFFVRGRVWVMYP